MVKSKTELFSNDEIFVSKIAKALSHPARVKILKVLSEKNTCICGEIVDLLPLAQSTVSQHIKELRDAGLITGELEGPKSCYCIDSRVLNKAKEELTKLLSNICC